MADKRVALTIEVTIPEGKVAHALYYGDRASVTLSGHRIEDFTLEEAVRQAFESPWALGEYGKNGIAWMVETQGRAQE